MLNMAAWIFFSITSREGSICYYIVCFLPYAIASFGSWSLRNSYSPSSFTLNLVVRAATSFFPSILEPLSSFITYNTFCIFLIFNAVKDIFEHWSPKQVHSIFLCYLSSFKHAFTILPYFSLTLLSNSCNVALRGFLCNTFWMSWSFVLRISTLACTSLYLVLWRNLNLHFSFCNL